jgi:hypothetical protein
VVDAFGNLSLTVYFQENIVLTRISCQVEGKALLGEPPQELNLTDTYKRQHMAKKAIEQTTPGPSDFWQNMAGLMMMQNVGAHALFGNPIIPMNPMSTMSPNPLSTMTPVAPHTPSAVILSPMKRPAAPVNTPSLKDWAFDLVLNESRKSYNFADFVNVLAENGIEDLDDLLSFSDTELVKITEMTIGLTKRILRYAEADIATLHQDKHPHLD